MPAKFTCYCLSGNLLLLDLTSTYLGGHVNFAQPAFFPLDINAGARTEDLVTSFSVFTAVLGNNTASRHNKSGHFSSALHH
eukprot:1158288-Pelagomonas_calceolata.AAC.3